MPPKKKELPDHATLYADTISRYPLEIRVKLYELIGTGIKNEALSLKTTGEKAAAILSNLENGKA